MQGLIKQHYYFLIAFLLTLSVACKKEKELQHPFVDFTFTGNQSTVPVSVKFNCNVSSSYKVVWDFGDGTIGEGVTIWHTYHKQGYFSVYVKVIGEDAAGGAVHEVNVSPYTKLKIYQINGTAPALKSDGTTWDVEPGETDPDLYFKIYDSNGMEVSGTNGYPYDANTLISQYPVFPQVIVNDFSKEFTVYFMDYDLGNLQDDIIGEFKFRPTDYFQDSLDFPDHFSKTNASLGAVVDVKIIWSN